MTSKVRIGLVGTSWYADLMYLPILHGYPQAELAALCGRNRGRAEELAAKYNIPQVFTDYREMIAQGKLDAVIVAAPDDLHYPITIEALNADLHVLCDKPLALRAEQAREMYERALTARVTHMVLFTYRWMPFFRFARDLIEQGYIGRCYHCEFRFLMGFGRDRVYRWRFDQSRANGSLGDSGSHMADLARWLVGDIVRVQATLGTHVARPGAEEGKPLDPANDSALLLAKFANGAHGVIQVSSVAHLADHEMRQSINLYGEHGSLEVDISHWGADDWAAIRGARGQDAKFTALDVPAAYWGDASRSDPFEVFSKQATGCRLFVDAVLENRQVAPNFYDGYKAQQVIEAALESHRSGRAVNIPSEDANT